MAAIHSGPFNEKEEMAMPIPDDYVERVYAGVLGKLIGVYLGRPFEGWTYERITRELGEINYFVHEPLGVPLIVTDDDISGTFTFLRALPDYGHRRDLTPAQIGQTWLNYIIERRSILWWGGRGNSTEHTAYLNLKEGIPAPRSGSIAQNGKVVAEQIGAQIFIDGWAMVAPGDPELAADLACRAGSVSHDGEALYGAQVIAAMEAQAFVEPNIDKLLDTAVRFIPKDSIIYRMIADIRNWHSRDKDWRKTRERIAAEYGYDKYGGNCHMVPNHGLIILALLYGEDNFQKSLMIANTSGWDTDCNSGNVGCLMGIKNGLEGLAAGPDFRSVVADRLYLPTADGGRAISDAVAETFHIVNIGRSLSGLEPLHPKGGARFHFDLPGSVQGFQPDESVEARGTASVENVDGHSRRGERSLAIRYVGVAVGRIARVATPTFVPSEAIAVYFEQRGYRLICSPTLYSGQIVEAGLAAAVENRTAVGCHLYVRVYGEEDQKVILRGPKVELDPGAETVLTWQMPDTDGAPIAEVGLEISSARRADGTLYLDYLTWNGTPRVTFHRPKQHGLMWRRAWVNALDHEDRVDYGDWYPETFRLLQNRGRGMLIQGTREWTDYQVSASLAPHLCKATGLAARVQGLQRYYALLLCADSTVCLVKVLDGETVLAEKQFPWEFGKVYDLGLQVQGSRLVASVNGQAIFDHVDKENPITGGAIALICEEGRVGCEQVAVQPAHL
jgi:ADP-ribosylglycohydrolase